MRWLVLHVAMRFPPAVVSDIALCCAILHNIAIAVRDVNYIPSENYSEDDDVNVTNLVPEAANTLRRAYIIRYCQ
jgi:hypothetical protein